MYSDVFPGEPRSYGGGIYNLCPEVYQVCNDQKEFAGTEEKCVNLPITAPTVGVQSRPIKMWRKRKTYS